MEEIKPVGEFTQHLWQSAEDIYHKIIQHPFILQLAKGSLAHQHFAHYLSQDILYIRDDNKALDLLSKKAINEQEKDFFNQLATEGLAIEKVLHQHFLTHFKVKEATQKSPIIQGYTDFLLQHSKTSSYAVGTAALLPCFWIYHEIGRHITSLSTENNVYQKWIDTYQGEEFELYVRQYIQIVEHLALKASDIEKKKMTNAFVKATHFELSFFEEAMLVNRTLNTF